MDSLSLRIKGDSFVVESNIHFPTDLNLLWDCLRKLLEMIVYFQMSMPALKSKIHVKKWLKEVRRAYRICSEIHRKKGRNYEERLEESTTCYLSIGEEVVKRGKALLEKILVNSLKDNELTESQQARLQDFLYFLEMSEKHLDLVNRRILLKETIPHGEKVFSIFEDHVEWNSKGKSNKQVELGHNVLIATDQYGCILYSEVYESQTDKGRTINLGNKLSQKYGEEHKMESISLDRNFYSSAAEKSLLKQFDIVVLPKAGRPSKLELTEGENADYQNRKRKHSCVEGNINQLEHNGLGVCPDKGIEGFKRYVAYGVLAYNAHRLGMMLVREEREAAKRARKKAKRLQAA